MAGLRSWLVCFGDLGWRDPARRGSCIAGWSLRCTWTRCMREGRFELLVVAFRVKLNFEHAQFLRLARR